MRVVSRSCGEKRLEFDTLDAGDFAQGSFALDTDGNYFLRTDEDHWVVIALPEGEDTLELGMTFYSIEDARIVNADDLALSIP